MNQDTMRKVLIIEDDEGLNHLISRNLKRAGFSTYSAFSGEQTISTLRDNQSMILLMDYKLPDMTAMEVLEKLNELQWIGPFLIMTGNGDERIAVELMKQGAIDYIVKDSNFLDVIPQKIERACFIAEQQDALVKAENEISRLASFPEVNPYPVVEIDFSGYVRYLNPAAKIAFPEMEKMGVDHPFFEGVIPMLDELKRNHDVLASREIQIEDQWYHQTINLIYEIKCIHVYSLNITDLKNVQTQLMSSLKEKEILLRELYHRTKNNMQVISSMLRLHSRQETDAKLKNLLKEIEMKIVSMALVHQKLYESNDLSHLNLKEYFSSLLILIRESYNVGLNVKFVLEGQDVHVLIDTAIPLGLALNELITNSLKHAFPNNQEGLIKITVLQNPLRELTVEISDDGIGLPGGFDLQKNSHLGLETVVDLVEYQLHGSIHYNNKNGLLWKIQIDEEQYKPRV